MSEEIYLKLREQLDKYALGFPVTDSGVELKILKRIFTKDDAELYLEMGIRLEEPKAVAERTGRDLEETADHLEDMAMKGLLFLQM